MPTSLRPERFASHFAVSKLSLTARDIATLDALPQAQRPIDQVRDPAWAP